MCFRNTLYQIIACITLQLKSLEEKRSIFRLAKTFNKKLSNDMTRKCCSRWIFAVHMTIINLYYPYQMLVFLVLLSILTSKLQMLDSGIIKYLKKDYQHHSIGCAIDLVEVRVNEVYKVDIFPPTSCFVRYGLMWREKRLLAVGRQTGS